MAHKNLVIITKIILIYSLFFIGIKIIAILRGAWLEANLVLCIPFVLLAGFGVYLNKSKNYSWIYVISGVLVAGLMRYFEKEWAEAIQRFLT